MRACTTLDPRGACLIGEVGWELVKETASKLGKACGCYRRSNDGCRSGCAEHRNRRTTARILPARSRFSRSGKTAKEHGRLKRIEGNFSSGDSVVVVDDVITTGGSTIQAIDAIEEAGGQIAFVIVLVDGEEGGRANIEKRGYKVVPIFTRADLTRNK